MIHTFPYTRRWPSYGQEYYYNRYYRARALKWRSELEGEKESRKKRKAGGEKKERGREGKKGKGVKKSHSGVQINLQPSTLKPTAYRLKVESHVPYNISIANLDFDDLTVAALTPPIMLKH